MLTKDDEEHLRWIYARLKRVHHENSHFDYMQRFKEIIVKIHLQLEKVNYEDELDSL